MKTRYILSTLLVFVSSAVYSNITKTFNISDAISIQEEKLQDVTFSRISLKGSVKTGEVGAPEIPVLSYQFYVPFGEVPTDVSIEMKDVNVLTLEHYLYPNQEPESTANATTSSSSLTVSDTTFATDPSKMMEYEIKTKGDGINVVNVHVNPITYDASTLTLSYAQSFSINIKTKKASSTTKLKIRERDINTFVSYLRRTVANKEDMEPNLKDLIRENISSQSTLRSGSGEWEVPFYEYVVITSEELAPAFEPLVTWKRRKGLNAGIVTMEDILKDDMAKDGDVLSDLNDNAGKLKAYLQASYEHDGQYVLLGGGEDVVPIRYGFGNDSLKATNFKYTKTWAGFLDDNIPTDLYYSFVDVDWNKDRDEFLFNIYGQENKYSQDFYIGEQFLYVGRLLCTNHKEISNWITKQLIYEQNPGLGDLSYLSNSLITTADHLLDEDVTVKKSLPQYLKKRIDTIKDEHKKECIMPVSPTGNDMVRMMNEVKYGFISNHNHGAPTTIALNTYGYNGLCVNYKKDKNEGIIITCPYKDEPYHELDKRLSKFCFTSGSNVDYSEPGNPLYVIEEDKNSADDLNAEMYKYPFILYSNACSTMPYDEYNGYKAKKQPNLGEALTTRNKTGCVAYLGNTRSGWVGISVEVEEKFLQQIDKELEYNEYIRIADYELSSKIAYIEECNWHLARWVALVHNLLGCPETNMWMFEPQMFLSPKIERNEGSVKITLLDDEIQNMTEVHITSADDNAISYRVSKTIDSEAKSVTFEDVPENFYVVITQPRHLPYIYSSVIDGCVIQDEIFTEERSFICDKIRAGEKVTNEKAYGKVIVKEGSKLHLESLEKTELKGGFQVEKGGSLEVR